jgi:hypothetical protein
MLPRRLIAMLCFTFLASRTTIACSVIATYIRPTNFELVHGADAIILAEAMSFKKESARQEIEFGKFTFKTLERLKGDFADAAIEDQGDTFRMGNSG